MPGGAAVVEVTAVVADSVVKSIGGGICVAADVVARVIEFVVGGAGQAVSDVVETVGTLGRNGLDALGGLVAKAAGIGPVLRFVLHWLAVMVSGTFELAATAVQALFDLAVGLAAGLIRLVFGGIGGLLAWDAATVSRGLGDLASSIAGSVVLLAGKALALIQAIVFMQQGERALTDHERTVLKQVFRSSVALYNVRLVEGFSGLFSVNPRPFTLGNTIYMKGDDPAANLDTVVHESTHVWQFQHAGVRYATDALWAQATISGQGEYVWEDEASRGRSRWLDFNREAQAQLVQNIWQLGTAPTPPAPTPPAGPPPAAPPPPPAPVPTTGAFYTDHPVGAGASFFKNGVDHTGIAVQCADALRGTTAWRLSGLF